MRSVIGLGVLITALALLACLPLLGPQPEQTDRQAVEDQELRLAGEGETTVEGSPSSDDEVKARGQAGEHTLTLRLKKTPARALDELPVADRLRYLSPVGPLQARMLLEAGPVVLDGEGALSPRFPLRSHVVVEPDGDIDRAWLRIDEDPIAELARAGDSAQGQVWIGHLRAGTLPSETIVHLDVVFERQAGPVARQLVLGPGWDVYTDEEGPGPPDLAWQDENVVIRASAERFEAQVRGTNGSWAPVSVSNATIELRPSGEERWVQARGIDAVGNPGAWSSWLHVPAAANEAPGDPEPWRLVSPSDGQRVQGIVPVDWQPAEGIGLVEVRARPSHADHWQPVGSDDEPPVLWRTGFVPDGDWQLHVRAHTTEANAGATSRIVHLTVDNLDEVAAFGPGASDPAAAHPGFGPRSSSPLPAALASVTLLFVVVGGAWQAWTRRHK